MVATKPKILQHVLTILEIETKGQKLLLSQGIDSIRNMIHNNYIIYKYLVENKHSKLFMVGIYQTFLFQQRHHTNFIRSPITTKADILYKFTEEE